MLFEWTVHDSICGRDEGEELGPALIPPAPPAQVLRATCLRRRTGNPALTPRRQSWELLALEIACSGLLTMAGHFKKCSLQELKIICPWAWAVCNAS